jgi:hypothetical protein
MVDGGVILMTAEHNQRYRSFPTREFLTVAKCCALVTVFLCRGRVRHGWFGLGVEGKAGCG